MSEIRLDKLLSETTAYTRSQLKQIIKSGRVSVNGTAVTAPETKLDPTCALIELDGESVSYAKFHYFMLNKPAEFSPLRTIKSKKPSSTFFRRKCADGCFPSADSIRTRPGCCS